MRLPALLLLFLPLIAGAQSNGVRQFTDWVFYTVPAQGTEPAIAVVETARPVRGISMLYTCTSALEGPEESLLVLNPGFAEMPEGKRFETLFTFGEGDRRDYVDAELLADPQHATLDVVRGRRKVLDRMQAFTAFIITQGDTAITEIAIPTEGFSDALARARDRCGVPAS